MSIRFLCLPLLLASTLAAQGPTPPAQKKDDRYAALMAMVMAAKKTQAPADADEVTRLKVERLNVLGEVIDARVQMYELGKGDSSPEWVMQTVRMCRDAGLDVARTPQEHLIWLGLYLDVTREVERVAKARLDEGLGTPGDVALARALRLDAQIQVAAARGRRPNP
jgi:hypothetical protein